MFIELVKVDIYIIKKMIFIYDSKDNNMRKGYLSNKSMNKLNSTTEN